MSRLISTRELHNVVTKRKTEYGRLSTLVDEIVEEMVRKTPTAKAISLDRIKEAREEILDWNINKVMDGCSEPFRLGVATGLDIASVILDKLIESEEQE